VPHFLVELYVPRSALPDVDGRGRRAQAAGGGLPGVECLRSILVPEDETCFLLYEAASAEQVEQALRLAGLPFERITQANAGTASTRS
jgi:hypothetical protein